METPVDFYMDTLRTINVVLDGHAVLARDAIRRAEGLQKAGRRIELAMAEELTANTDATASSQGRRAPALVDPLTGATGGLDRGLRALAAGLHATRSDQDDHVPQSPGELVRAARATTSDIAVRRQMCLSQLKRIDEDALVHLGVKLEPEERWYLLLQFASENVDHINELKPDPDQINRVVSTQPGGATEMNHWMTDPQRTLVPVISAIWVRNRVLKVLQLADNAQAEMNKVDASADHLVETDRHADIQRQQLLAEAAADRRDEEATAAAAVRQTIEDRRRDREGVLATAGVVLIAPGLVASVYGADVLRDDGSDIGMALLMALAILVGFLAVRLVSHGNRRASKNENGALELAAFATAMLALLTVRSRTYIWPLHDWERASIGALSVAAIGAVVARMAQRGHSEVENGA